MFGSLLFNFKYNQGESSRGCWRKDEELERDCQQHTKTQAAGVRAAAAAAKVGHDRSMEVQLPAL